MNSQTPPSRIARWLAAQSGTDTRVQELTSHLDQIETHGGQITLLDVASLGVLALRTSVKAVATFSRYYAGTLLAVTGTWLLARWVGIISYIEGEIERTWALESFQFVGPNLLVLFAVILLPSLAVTGLIRRRRRSTRHTS